MNNALKTSPELRRMAMRALASIILFILTYIFLVLFAIGLTLVCGYLGYLLVMAYAHWVTFMLGLVLLAIGITVLIFVLKFIFKRTTKTEQLLVEVKAIEEPELFALIEEIVNEVKTNLPKKVYLSPEVNAGVFYESLFFSMFLPVKKNLQIGMGILNTHYTEEFKAVLAHEFGHFSQRSMRLGSYVHNANKVLYNMLYDNDKFERTIEVWGDTFSYFKLAGLIASVVIKGMQAVLKKVYEILNVNYYALSREMEYHADAVATAVAGSRPVIVSLLRMELAETSLNVVYNYHEEKINQGLKPLNLYPQHYFVMNHFAIRRKIEVKNGLPEIDVNNIWKSRGSKIVMRNQWATHPDIEDRIRRVKAFGTLGKMESNDIAVNILVNKEELQERLTSKIFEHHFIYAKAPQLTDFQQFEADFLSQSSEVFFDERYFGYYDDRLPYYRFDQSLLDDAAQLNLTYDELFNAEGLTEIMEQTVLESDISILEKIELEPDSITNFDYDGVKYQTGDCANLISFLKEKLEDMKGKTERGDILIFNYFKSLALQLNQIDVWKENSNLFKQVADATFTCQDAYFNLVNASAFMAVQTKFDEIREKMLLFKETEAVFKRSVKFMLENSIYKAELTEENIVMFEKFLSEDWTYFVNSEYAGDDLDRLTKLLPVFQGIYYAVCFKYKRQFLDYQSSLFPEAVASLSA